MPILAPNQPFEQGEPVLVVQNRLEPGAHRFSLVVVNSRGMASEPDEFVVTVRRGTVVGPGVVDDLVVNPDIVRPPRPPVPPAVVVNPVRPPRPPVPPPVAAPVAGPVIAPVRPPISPVIAPRDAPAPTPPPRSSTKGGKGKGKKHGAE